MITEEERPKGFMDWLKESVTVKLAFIGVLILVLLIPSSMVDGLIIERASRQTEIMDEIAQNWGGSQMVQGPALVIPYKKIVKVTDANGKETMHEISNNVYILPYNLIIKAELSTEVLHRGIFKAVVYNTSIHISGNFDKLNLAALSISASELMLDKAKLTFGISDLKGLKNNPIITAAGQKLSAQPALNGSALFKNGLESVVDLTGVANGKFDFDYMHDVKGSDDLHFLPLGKTTDVQVTGSWASPSFDGRYLPNTRVVNKNGFKGQWRMLYYNRPYPQQWANDNSLFNDKKTEAQAVFGVKLRLPVDEYQKTTRTSKYAILIILLTFVSLFLTEIVCKQSIHAFNYFLIGAAMIVYYTLLLSFSERVGFNIAYLIASVSTITLVSVFISSLLKNKGAAAVFAMILSIFYTFIFVIIQMEDLALLIGSIALFIIIALLMYFSRKINWDKR
jgi:inner membrane protein